MSRGSHCPFIKQLAMASLAFLCIIAGGCSRAGNESQTDNSPFLVKVGNKKLTAEELSKALPRGLSAEDSARYVKVYVKNWLDTHLVNDYAREEIDMSEIDRLTEEYRNRLIMLEYRRRLFESQADSIPADSIKAYYERHKDEFKLERPLVKGTYLKIPYHAANLNILRRLYRSEKPDDIDRLEKESLSSAIHYDYFRDHWVDWEQIETRIPHDFGAKADDWLKSNKTLDIKAGNFVYLLYISEVLPAGSTMPLEFARQNIVTRLLNTRRAEFDNEISRQLYTRALQSGRLVVNIPLE